MGYFFPLKKKCRLMEVLLKKYPNSIRRPIRAPRKGNGFFFHKKKSAG